MIKKNHISKLKDKYQFIAKFKKMLILTNVV